MNLLAEIEGTKGENLTSKGLRYFVLRSPVLRDGFLEVLSAEGAQGPLNTVSHFACYAEEWTEDEGGQRGRIDLVMETDTCVIGIENKLFAGFQADQPRKYLATLSDRAKKLASMRGYDHNHVVAIIGPESRRKEIKPEPGGERRCFYVAWESIMKSLLRCSRRTDVETQTMVRMFLCYLKDHLSFYRNFQRDYPHLKRGFPPGGSSCQKTLVGKIWQFMPGPGPRLSAGDRWCGYYFATGKEYGMKTGWYGFLSIGKSPSGSRRYFPDAEEARNGEAELVFVTNFDVEFTPASPFKKVQSFKDDFLGRNNKDAIRAWTLDIDKSWDNAAKWEAELKPFRDAAE